MTDTFANGPSAPGDAAPQQAAGDVTGTLAELERKLRELERELTSIGRRRELPAEEAAPRVAQPERTSGRLVDEALEPPTRPTPIAPAPVAPPPAAGAPTPARPETSTRPTPAAPVGPAEPATSAEHGVGQPVKFVRPLESARAQLTREPGERPRPTEAQLASVAELRRFRDRLERFARELATEYDALLSRVMAGLTSAAPQSPAAGLSSTQPAAPAPPVAEPAPPVAPPVAAPVAEPAPPVAEHAPPVAEPAPPREEETLFEGRVELGVGPFYDLASLSAFERRLAGLPSVSGASVRRFEASHAVVDLQLSAPVALVRELRSTVESDFSIREVADGRILLTFDDV